MLPWKLQKRHILPVSQNLSSVYFSPAKFQLVSCNLSLAMIWQMTLYSQTAITVFSHLKILKHVHPHVTPQSSTELFSPFFYASNTEVNNNKTYRKYK